MIGLNYLGSIFIFWTGSNFFLGLSRFDQIFVDEEYEGKKEEGRYLTSFVKGEHNIQVFKAIVLRSMIELILCIKSKFLGLLLLQTSGHSCPHTNQLSMVMKVSP